MESQRRSERTKAGLARAKAQGKRLGRPPGSKDRRKRRRRQRLIALKRFLFSEYYNTTNRRLSSPIDILEEMVYR